MVEGEQLAHVAGHGALRGDEGGDLRVDLALELVHLGIVTSDLVGELGVALHERATGSLERVLDPRAKAQDVILDAVEGPVERGPRAPSLRCRVDCRLHVALLPPQPNRPVM